MTTDVAVVGIGNVFRRDDGVGPAVVTAIDVRAVPGVSVLIGAVDPTVVLEACACARLAVLVDAATAAPSAPGRVHRCTMDQFASSPSVSSHGVDISAVFALGEALGRLPEDVVVFAVEVVETGHGIGLTPPVKAAVPRVVDAVLAEIGRVGIRSKAEGRKH
jgi:hydrogenase maturation protease